MKKIVVGILLFLLSCNICFAEQLFLDRETKYQKKIMEVGFRILNANRIEKRMTFNYNNKKDANACAYSQSKRIDVYKGLFLYFDDDNEIAAILSHEIAHGIDYHAGFWRQIGMSFKPVHYEKKADKKAVDLMVNAGYNPVALIIILNKLAEEPNLFELRRTHPAGSERLAYIYEYIYAKYPAYLADNDYRTNLYYQNFLLTSKIQRELVRQKYAPKNLVDVNNKTKKK